ncbi:MAG: hypothetical protein ACI8XG_001199 [Congregibacter sp.]|jgi:hypothetical protein
MNKIIRRYSLFVRNKKIVFKQNIDIQVVAL